jgi:hypothetical protein
MELIVDPTGNVRCVYAEAINLAELGCLSIERGSHVEPTASGEWTADMSPVGGPILGPFGNRAVALAAEAAWLSANWLNQPLG